MIIIVMPPHDDYIVTAIVMAHDDSKGEKLRSRINTRCANGWNRHGYRHPPMKILLSHTSPLRGCADNDYDGTTKPLSYEQGTI